MAEHEHGAKQRVAFAQRECRVARANRNTLAPGMEQTGAETAGRKVQRQGDKTCKMDVFCYCEVVIYYHNDSK